MNPLSSGGQSARFLIARSRVQIPQGVATLPHQPKRDEMRDLTVLIAHATVPYDQIPQGGRPDAARPNLTDHTLPCITTSERRDLTQRCDYQTGPYDLTKLTATARIETALDDFTESHQAPLHRDDGTALSTPLRHRADLTQRIAIPRLDSKRRDPTTRPRGGSKRNDPTNRSATELLLAAPDVTPRCDRPNATRRCSTKYRDQSKRDLSLTERDDHAERNLLARDPATL